MAGKRYSAGAIFLQVVPVFANVQRAIEDEAKNIDRALGDQMEKSGEKAGERAGKAASKKMGEELRKGSGEFERDFHKNIDGINRALGGIDTQKLGNDLRRELAGVKRELASLKDIDLTVDVDRRKADVALAELEGRTRALRDGVKIVFRTDLDQALKGFAKIEAAKESVSDPVHIDVRVDTAPAERKLGAFEKSIKSTMDKAARHLDGSLNKEVRRLKDELDYLSKLRVGIDIGSTQLRREIDEITAELQNLSQMDPEIDVKFEAGRAWSELAAFSAAVEKIDGKDIDINVDVDTAAARRGLFGLSASGEDAANSFRSFNIVLLAAAGAGPALIPILGAIAGGLFALGPAAAVAGAGLASVLIGFSGIGDAVGALQAQQDQMGTSTQQAAKTEEDSARRIADARRSAADAVESALERQKDAREAYADSIDDVREAEQALAEARAAAKGQGDDIGDRIKDNQLGQDQGLLDVFNATVNFNSVMADGSATNAEQEQARINMEKAKRALEELREEAKELAKEQRRWDNQGVNGTQEVKDAQENLSDAVDRQKDAYDNLRDAIEAVDEARANGARQVAEATRAQADAMGQISAQQNAINNAFDKLGPAGKKFALFIQALKEGFYDFRNDIQTVLLPQVQQAIESFFGSKSGSIARDALIGLADSFGRFALALSASFQGEAWEGFFTTLRDLGPGIQDAYGNAFIKFMEAIASMLTTAAPFALQFAEGFAKLMEAFADWAKSKEGTESIQKFLDWVQKMGPSVMEFLETFIDAALNLAIALAPWGEVVLKVLTGFLDIIANMDPKVLGGIVTTLVVLITASQLAYAAMNLLMAGAALLGSPIGLIVFAIVAIGAAVAYLYTQNEDFREFVQGAWEKISKAFEKAWEESIKPALMEMWDALQALWKDVLQPFFEWLGPILLWLIENLIPLLARVWSVQMRAIAFAIKNVLIPAIKIIAKSFVWLWKNILKPVFGWISEAAIWLFKNVLKPVWEDMAETWDDLMTGMKWVWNNVLKPIWDYITDKALPKLEGAFETTVDAIRKIWAGLKKVVGAPVKFVLDTIINNGLIDGFNKVAGWVGMDGFNHIPIPEALQSYATGGVLPGYTPGRDVHKYVSPTGGRLELSGGEAIMRPEFTAAVGPGYVDRMNKIARSGGAGAVRKAMSGGSYWMGGVLPLPGASFSQHTSGYSGFAGDLNVGGGYDDFGMAIKAWKDGIVAQMNYIGDASYGRWAVLNHPGQQSSLYAHMSDFAKIAVGDAVRAGQTIGYVGDLGNTGNPPSSHLHFEINGGAVDFADTASGGKNHRKIPGWMMDVVKNPLASVKEWITKPLSGASNFLKDSPVFDAFTKVPLLAAKKTVDKVWDIVPGWVKTAAGWAGNAADWAVGGVKNAGQAIGDAASGIGNGIADGAGAVGNFLGFAEGGILPYNGTMMYDNGGYLPPGLTTVMNLTGKPEPVFTNDQWSNMEGGPQGGNIHYEPHFEGSDLTAADVAGDLNFTFRRIRRGGKYASVGDQ